VSCASSNGSRACQRKRSISACGAKTYSPRWQRAHAAQHVGLALLVQVEQARIVKRRPRPLRARSAAARASRPSSTWDCRAGRARRSASPDIRRARRRERADRVQPRATKAALALQQALFEGRAHTAALNRRLAASRARDGKAQLAPLGLRDARQRGRRGPLQKLRDAPRAVEAAERAVVEPGVESIANINRIVPAVVGEARDKRKRETFADAVADSHRSSRCRLPPSLESTVLPLAVQHSEPVVVQRTVACASAKRQRIDRPRTPHNRDRRRCSAIRIALTLVNNGDQQHAEQTSLAKLHCFTVSCRGSV
jgi:hypothetical protein